MNIYDPATSRVLAALIQGVKWKNRPEFLKDAKEAKDFKSFLLHFLRSYDE